MKFGCLFAVQDIAIARAFYEELFGLTVTEDFGRMVGFDCGLILQQDFDWLTGIPKSEMKNKENNCEIYFEKNDFDIVVQKIKKRQDITLLHDALEHPWGQRIIRFYDLDNHLIEVGESMKSVVEKFLSQGLTIEAIADKMDVGSSDVQKFLKTDL